MIEDRIGLFSKNRAPGSKVFSFVCDSPECNNISWSFNRNSRYCSPGCYPRLLGANSPIWNGGKTKNMQGYTLVRSVGHPRATRAGHYILEHQIVMEKHLGRYLLPHENVHHKNGLRSDNRIENLELWNRPQIPGQRAIDLLMWCVDNHKENLRALIEVDDIAKAGAKKAAA